MTRKTSWTPYSSGEVIAKIEQGREREGEEKKQMQIKKLYLTKNHMQKQTSKDLILKLSWRPRYLRYGIIRPVSLEKLCFSKEEIEQVREIYYEELSHGVLVTEKSHYQPSARQTPGKADGAV